MPVQPSLIHEGWVEKRDGDESCRTIFERHYSHRPYADGRKPKQIIGPGVKKPLLMADGLSLFAFRKHISDDGQTGVNIAIFRREGGIPASEQIKQAIAHAREKWWPSERFYTYVNPRKVKPTMFRGYPVWGWCFYKAGFKYVGTSQSGKHILALEPRESCI